MSRFPRESTIKDEFSTSERIHGANKKAIIIYRNGETGVFTKEREYLHVLNINVEFILIQTGGQNASKDISIYH